MKDVMFGGRQEKEGKEDTLELRKTQTLYSQGQKHWSVGKDMKKMKT